MMIQITKYFALFVIASTLLIISMDDKNQVQSRRLRLNLRKFKCGARNQKICNHLGSFCHAEVITLRKRRSISQNQGNRRRLRKQNKCHFCKKVCWNNY